MIILFMMIVSMIGYFLTEPIKAISTALGLGENETNAELQEIENIRLSSSSLNTGELTFNGEYCMPIETQYGYTITSEFGYRTHPVTGIYNYNTISDYDDYNTFLGALYIENMGLQNSGAATYTVTPDTTNQFVTAVGIPCSWDDEDNTWLPTKIVVTDTKNNDFTLDSYDEIREAAFVTAPGNGFMLRAQDISGFDTSNGIAKVVVTLPGLPQQYKSYDRYGYHENSPGNTDMGGIWGRLTSAVGTGTKSWTNSNHTGVHYRH